MPLLSALVVVALTAVWLLVPSWGGWIFVGTSLGLMQWRVWKLYVQRLAMSVYVYSPSMAIQNRSAVWLAIGAAIGAIRSGIGDDMGWAAVGALLAVTLFASRGLLFPNAAVISQACGYPLVSLEELQSLLKRLDYPTLLAFNKESKRAGGLAGDLTAYLDRNVQR